MAAAKHLAHVVTPLGVARPPGGFSHVVVASGRLVAISGQLAQDERGELVGRGDIVAQTRQVFENLARCLAAAGAGFGDVVRLGYFLTDMRRLPEVRAVRDEFLDPERLPASTAVQVVGLALPEALIEVEALAVVDDA